MHTHIFLFFYFSYFFIFSIFYFIIFFWGLGPAQPTWAGLGWTQPAQPGHWPKPVTRLAEARMRELLTHAVHSGKVIKITFSLYLCKYT
jgi:hypothetical protein